ncbi:uncharacterized protein V6R79_010771 [Siganus canaliculatus]
MSDNTQKDLQVILCEMCTEEDRKPAKKTCMKCEISMCVQHLQAHLTTPVLLQTHPLTEPTALDGTAKCPQHGKLLEYYCLDDMTCLCVSCAIEDQHRLHNMKTFSTAHKELMDKLSVEQQALMVKTDDEEVSLEMWEKNEREKLGRCSVRLIDAVKHLRDITLTSVQSSVSTRMVSIKTSKTSIQAAQKETDTFRFLQMYSQVHEDMEKAKAVDLRKGLEPGSDCDKLVLEIQQHGEKMVKQAHQFWGSLLTLVDPQSHQELVPTDPDLVFDPHTLSPAMSLSKDMRKVFYSREMGQCNATLLIRSTNAVPNYQRWVVSLPENCNWTVGLCDTRYAKSLSDGHVYGLSYDGKRLIALRTENDDCCVTTQNPLRSKTDGTNTEKKHSIRSKTLSHLDTDGSKIVPQANVVEVYWNFTASSVSFFNRVGQHQRGEITTVKMSLNNWDLKPFVRLGKADGQSQRKQNWQCKCGKNYYRDGSVNSVWIDRNTGCNFQQCKCSCGAFVGDVPITEMVCELK